MVGKVPIKVLERRGKAFTRPYLMLGKVMFDNQVSVLEKIL